MSRCVPRIRGACTPLRRLSIYVRVARSGQIHGSRPGTPTDPLSPLTTLNQVYRRIRYACVSVLLMPWLLWQPPYTVLKDFRRAGMSDSNKALPEFVITTGRVTICHRSQTIPLFRSNDYLVTQRDATSSWVVHIVRPAHGSVRFIVVESFNERSGERSGE